MGLSSLCVGLSLVTRGLIDKNFRVKAGVANFLLLFSGVDIITISLRESVVV